MTRKFFEGEQAPLDPGCSLDKVEQAASEKTPFDQMVVVRGGGGGGGGKAYTVWDLTNS